MKKLSCYIITLIILNSASAQSLKKIPISKTGCNLYSYCDMKFDISKSVDSSAVYTGECVNGDVTYGIILVKLENQPANITMAEDLLIAFLDHLKKSYTIINAVGYGRGHTMKENNAVGVLDYWEDNEKNKWKVKGWTDKRYIGVMYAYSLKELPEQKVNVFLDGLRLPADK